jgi:large subunit ribosomal protein L5e
MGFVKIIKNKPYFKRFQVKYRRRREGKTDYRARKRLVAQDKNKYNAHKFRLVVRFTNKDIIAQIIYSEISGDKVLRSAYAHELPRYGLEIGLTNYAAAYCVGLLVARRHLKALNMDTLYKGVDKVDGTNYNVLNEIEDDEQRNPFKAILDVGLVATTTGARVFSALKGAVDGGLNVPHSESRFAGYDSEAKQFNPDTLRKYIFGGHVADYMTLLSEDEEKYKRQFGQFIKRGIAAGDLEALYTKVHAAIRADPTFVPKEKKKYTAEQLKKYKKPHRLSYAQRKDKIRQKKATWAKKQASE